MKLGHVVLYGVLFGWGAGADAALAQDGAAATASGPTALEASQSASRSGGETLGPVIVTARRRREDLERTPEAVATFSQASLTEHAITSAFGLSAYTPGLNVEADAGNVGLPSFAIRGRGQVYGAAASSVETYFAEVPLSAPSQIPTLPPQFFDLASLDVLKGPQGTLFGRSTTGGAVSVTPKAPTDALGGYGRLQGGTYDDLQAEGALNLPLAADKAALRVAAFTWRRDGYMHTFAGARNDVTGRVMGSQTYDNVDESEARASLLLRPTAALTNTAIFTYHYDQTRASGGSGVMIDPVRGTVGAPGYGTFWTGSNVDFTKPPTRVWAVIDTAVYALSPYLSFENIFGFVDAEGFTNDAADADGLQNRTTIDLPAVPGRPRRNRQTTDELQLEGKSFEERLSWLVGGLWDRTREPGGRNINLSTESIIGAANPWGGPGSLLEGRFEQNNIDSYGAYASGTAKLTDRLNLTAGYRHSWYRIAYVSGCGTAIAPAYAAEPDGGAVCQALGFAGLARLPTLNTGGDAYSLDLDYHPAAGLMLYGGYRRGYKHGGYNPAAPTYAPSGAVIQTPFAAETVDDFYLGVKAQFRLVGRPARVNLEGYDDLYRDYQAAYLGVSGTPPAITLVATTL
ncbi:MAG: TonB-dependent receptor, partial [Caulobacteraceae bacterium]|nr:TonB-dependent receptor [Caulobacteraceae bacterium]